MNSNSHKNHGVAVYIINSEGIAYHQHEVLYIIKTKSCISSIPKELYIVGEDLGCDGIEIDFHSFSRPSHLFMQGMQYSIEENRLVDGKLYRDAEAAGVTGENGALNDYGCKHFATYIICGVNDVPYVVVSEVICFCLANKKDNTDWVHLPVANFDCYYGNTNFSKKWLSKIPDIIIEREVASVICRVKLKI